ncbi:MAG TPA: DUF4249 family protein [Paludibacter sp.]
MRKFKVGILFLFLLFFSGCVRNEIEETPWTTASVPMVFSVISPDYPVELYLGKSYFEKDAANPIPYPEAKVFMRGQDSAWVELKLQSADTSSYKDVDHLLGVVKGKTYYLRIVLNDRTLHAQTTVPVNGATIIEATCTVPAGNVQSNRKYSTENKAETIRKKRSTLSVNFTLPQNKDYGYYLSAFSTEIEFHGPYDSGFYQDNEFQCPYDNSAFTLNLITVDPYLKKFRFSETILFNQSYDDDFITAITSTFGGVLPAYSNIENGMGLFGSFSTDSKLITVTQLTE